MHCARVIVGVWCVGRSWSVVPVVGGVCVGGVCVGAQCILDKSSSQLFMVAVFFISVRLAITDNTIATMQSFVYARYGCVIVGGIPYYLVACYCVVVDLLYSLNHFYRCTFHCLTLSIMINVAVHTTQSEKNIRVGLKID